MNINSNNYKQFTAFILILVGISAAIVYMISYGLKSYGIEVPFYIETPSIPAVYALFFVLFDRVLWKNKIFKRLGIV